jgi:hypothetical protein
MLRNLILPVIAFVFALFGSAGATNDTVRVEGGLISVSVVDEVRSSNDFGRYYAATFRRSLT